MSFITICRKTWKAITRRQAAQGRDGDPAECILLYSGKDVVTNQYLIERSQDNQEMDAASLASCPGT